ncbi:TetR family transcriptional regulator [Pontivivens ytuae]|uniref:TetR family transcriptional regulator n=1 Tax=Pontivivens ytuae TaxID=2789856 RepID=A0A7S9LRA5_9RHOB|nr:TetR family transcriptional regulator [Pontivivens ytuae]QPH53852.1 TetR family transcriptional regulator [Pontivivens ytuae]
MTKMFQRARSPEHKEVRRRMILDAAARVLERDGFNGTSLNAIAQEAGVVKSGLYRYFESREEILLELLVADVQDLCNAFEQRIDGQSSVSHVADVMAECFIERPQLCLLTSRMASVLEHNITGDTIRGMKRRLNACSAQVADSLCRAIPHWQPEEAHRGLMMLYMMIAGLYPMTHPPEHVAVVLREPEFCDNVPDFEPTVRFAAQAMLRGIENIAQERRAVL